MSGVRYDSRFDNVVVTALPSNFNKQKLTDVLEAGLPRESYVTMEELERTFSISNYHVKRYLATLGAEAFGELKNFKEDGRRERGIGKKVYRSSVVSDIKELLVATIDTEQYRTEARETLEE